MCTTLPRAPAAALISSFSSTTYLSAPTSKPRTMSSNATSLSSLEQIRRCSTFAPSRAWTSWKCTVLDSVAEKSLTGMLTSPKVIVPFQIERGIAASVLRLGHPAVHRRLGAVGKQARAAALCLGRERMRDDALLAGHQRLEAVARDVGRIVLLARADLRVEHVGALEELGLRRARH